MKPTRLHLALSLATLAALSPPLLANGQGGARVEAGKPYVTGGNSATAFSVRVVYPDGRVSEAQLLRGERLAIDPASPGGGLAEGPYQYEIRPITGVANRSQNPNQQPQPRRPAISGNFLVTEGRVVLPAGPANPNSDRDDGSTGKYSVLAKDQVVADDMIVQGSICTGFDCVNNENFGADTLVLKENNLRIFFNDTSTSGSFPSNDWRITANDQASGGASYLSIDDATAGRTVFRVTAGAPANSLFVASSGNVGLGTSTPVLDMHVSSGNTPAMRLEQDGSSGFTAQTWDVAGNEANFFVRDVTNGSLLPFRIQPGAPSSSLYVASSGNVGLGTSAPAATLDVRGTMAITSDITYNDSSFIIRAGTTDGADTSRIIIASGASNSDLRGAFLQMRGNENPGAPGKVDLFSGTNGDVRIVASGTGIIDLDDDVEVAGNLTVTGTISPDYVFKPGFELLSIEDHATYMWQHSHLPMVEPAKSDDQGRGVINVAARSQGVLEELEYAHIYIDQLNNRVKQLERQAAERDATLNAVLKELRALKAARAD